MNGGDEAPGRRTAGRCHAFGDDALGELDAVGLVEALRAGTVSATELVEAAIARSEAVNPALNGLAYEGYDRARYRYRRRDGAEQAATADCLVHAVHFA